MYDICHPTYYNMSQLGCNDQVKLTTAFYVYMELCEVKRYWDVEYKYCEALQFFHLEAKKSKNAEIDIFIPWPACHNLTLDLISNMQHKLEKDKFTFVFKEGDTTSVYYSICSGIVKPISPEETKVLKQKEEKKFELEREIKRNTANLYDRALSLDNGSHEKDDKPSNNIITNEEESDAEEFFTPMTMECTEKTETCNSKFTSDVQTYKSSENTNIFDDLHQITSIKDVNGSSDDKLEPDKDIKLSDDSKESEFKSASDTQENDSTSVE